MYIYIDEEFKCHVHPVESSIPIDTDFFDGKCDDYIEGYIYVPSGEIFTREDGVTFQGEMITPWKPWSELDIIQREYELKQINELIRQNSELLDAIVSVIDDVYNQDLAEIENES